VALGPADGAATSCSQLPLLGSQPREQPQPRLAQMLQPWPLRYMPQELWLRKLEDVQCTAACGLLQQGATRRRCKLQRPVSQKVRRAPLRWRLALVLSLTNATGIALQGLLPLAMPPGRSCVPACRHNKDAHNQGCMAGQPCSP
jgi:hypothetical protein